MTTLLVIDHNGFNFYLYTTNLTLSFSLNFSLL